MNCSVNAVRLSLPDAKTNSNSLHLSVVAHVFLQHQHSFNAIERSHYRSHTGTQKKKGGKERLSEHFYDPSTIMDPAH